MNKDNINSKDKVSAKLDKLKRQIQETNPNITDDLLELLVEFVSISMVAKI